MCNLTIGTVFSKDARIPINDIRIVGVVVILVFNPSMTFVKICHFFSVGETSPLFKLNLYARKFWVGVNSPNRVSEQTPPVVLTAPSKSVVMGFEVTHRLDTGVAECLCFEA